MQKSLAMWLFLWVSTLLPAAFGFQLNETFGQFQSPGFPNAYEDNIYQTWNISVPTGFVIKLYFSHFNLEPSYRCDYDHVKILLEGQELAKLCGETSTDTEEAPGSKQYYSIGNNMTVIFRTDYSNEKSYSGFIAHYAAVDVDECNKTAYEEPACDHHCHNYLGGYYCSCKKGYLLDSDNRICRAQCSGNIFTERSGEFSSPNYPMSYAKSSNCDYRIEMEEGFSIVLEFVESFDVESHPDVPCPYDALKIITPKKKYEPFCGDQLPENITTLSNTIDIIFSTDSSGENTGWKIQYSTTATSCPYPIVPERGQITPKQSQYVFKDQFNLTCGTGYEIMQDDKGLASFIAICQKDGTWNKDMPECNLIDCAEPDEIANGNFTYTSTPPETTYLSTIQYACTEPYYKMKAAKNGIYTCAADGYWEGENGKQLPICEPVCGKPVKGSLSRIFGGFTAERGEFPWQALIYTANSFAGGALLYDNWILTAAHVVDGHANGIGISVVLSRNAHPAEATSEKVIIHAGYKGEKFNFDNDIALIKLNRKVSLGENILPICLPGTEPRYIVKEGDRGHVSGWGLTERKVTSRKLKYVEVTVGNHAVCKEVYSKQIREGIPLIVTDNMFCAGGKDGKDSCAGDSGGAYVFYDPVLQHWYVAGIVSWGLEDCGQAGFYGVYTNVFNYTSWIEETISMHS